MRVLKLQAPLFSGIHLSSHPATIHADNLSRDVGTCCTSEEDHYSLEVLRFPPSASRDSGHDTRVAVLVIDQSDVHIRVDVAGRDRIDGDALGYPLIRESLS